MQLREAVCDVCNQRFPLDADESKTKPALFGKIQGYVMKMEQSPDKKMDNVLKEYNADCCPDCWKKVHDYIVSIQK